MNQLFYTCGHLFPQPEPQLQSAVFDRRHKADRWEEEAPGGMQHLESAHSDPKAINSHYNYTKVHYTAWLVSVNAMTL